MAEEKTTPHLKQSFWVHMASLAFQHPIYCAVSMIRHEAVSWIQRCRWVCKSVPGNFHSLKFFIHWKSRSKTSTQFDSPNTWHYKMCSKRTIRNTESMSALAWRQEGIWGKKKFQKAAYKEVTISKTHQQTPKKQFPISIKNDEKGNKEQTWASDLSFGLNTRGQQKTSQRSLWKELIHRHQLYFIVLAMKAEGKKFWVSLTGSVEDFQQDPCGY